MTIITYTNTAEVIRIDKSGYLTNATELTLADRLMGSQNVQSPTLRISSPSVPLFNYVYIPDFNRYYFASTPLWVAANEWEIDLVCDVLYSNKDKILNLHGIASRLEDQGKYSMIIDDRIIAEATQYADVKLVEMNVADGFNGFNIQDDAAASRIVLSCFSGRIEEEATDTDGPQSMTITKDGATYNYSPSFNKDYDSSDGAYLVSGTGNYSIKFRGSNMTFHGIIADEQYTTNASSTTITISGINITQSTSIRVIISYGGTTRSYDIDFTV